MSSAPDTPIHRALEGYKAAVHAKDAAAFAALYDERIRVFDMWGAWQYRGIADWNDMAAGWFGSLGSERVVVDFDDIEATLSPELAVGHAFATYTAVAADGSAQRALTNRLTLVMQRPAGAWKIVHEHSSAPVDQHTGKVMLKR